MKLLLTSAGLVNQPIIKALSDLVVKPFSEVNLAFIPTAANIVPGHKDWLIGDLANCLKLDFKTVDIVDISAIPQQIWQPRLEQADILFFGGGNTHYLMDQVKKSGLQTLLPDWLKTKIYLGLSAGSEITCQERTDKYNASLFDEPSDGEKYSCLGLVDFHVLPHLNSAEFPNCRLENIKPLAEEIKETIYALDDNSAVKIDENKIEVVSTGQWQKFN